MWLCDWSETLTTDPQGDCRTTRGSVFFYSLFYADTNFLFTNLHDRILHDTNLHDFTPIQISYLQIYQQYNEFNSYTDQNRRNSVRT